ncbi:radical SAM protein [Occallatibacter riparius]|uniref:Radical SAM protein n=1 Tax=Occallatibacter riparius TaxID=1002689 RepID=A0A9J7BQD0_9BACT|nr:radical SAM protein [Occallatibacter riparius]UWZ84769.1 radical SAM protein [Occallatibacter riparius]
MSPDSKIRDGSLSARMFGLAGRFRDIDPQLTRVIVPWINRHPRYLAGFLRLVHTHAQSKRIRARMLADGLKVPPFFVLSVTSRCNLRCAGCYAAAVGTVAAKPARPGLDLSAWYRVVDEAIQLGVMAFLIAGGEPFLLPGIVNLFSDHPDRLFLVFTNGTALTQADYDTLKACTNTVIVVSLEGDRDLTDLRRGRGVYEKALGTLDRLRTDGILTGIAVTIGSANIGYWTDPHHIDELIAHSGPLAMFIEQIPTAGCDAGATLTDEQRRLFRQTVVQYRDRMTGGAFIIHSPGDEETLGGCVSAGRGFAHINPSGDVTACPVSALATHNVKSASLREALASPLFTLIRDNLHLLETEGHPCGLSAHALELEEMAEGLGAYRSGMSEAVSVEQQLISLS